MPRAVTPQHEINARLKGTKARTHRAFSDLYKQVQKGPLLSGVIRKYRPMSDDPAEQLPPESTRVQVVLEKELARVSQLLGPLMDLQLTQDATNCIAKADVIVDGRILIPHVPVTYLLFLDKQLTDLRTFVDSMPRLDPSEHWTLDTAEGWHASDPADFLKMRKVLRNHVRAEATNHHPAQVDVFHEDVAVGTWTTVKLSGALPATRAAEVSERIGKLIDAVKAAQAQANAVEAVESRAGDAVFSYLLAGRTPDTP